MKWVSNSVRSAPQSFRPHQLMASDSSVLTRRRIPTYTGEQLHDVAEADDVAEIDAHVSERG
jgi:hypothetical protein